MPQLRSIRALGALLLLSACGADPEQPQRSTAQTGGNGGAAGGASVAGGGNGGFSGGGAAAGGTSTAGGSAGAGGGATGGSATAACSDPTDLVAAALDASALSAAAEQPIVAVGASVKFEIQSPAGGAATYTIKEESRVEPALTSGTLMLEAGVPASVELSLDHAGYLLLEVAQGDAKALAGAAVHPCAIESLAVEPSDFDAFWSAQRTALDAVPPNPSVSERSDKASAGFKVFKFVLDELDGKHVYGWVTVPDAAGSYPVILEFPPFGDPYVADASWKPPNLGGAIYGFISIHDSDIEAPAVNPYQPENATDHEQNYFKWAVTAGLRALDYLVTRPEFDGEHVITTGKSQGGALATMVAGIDERVTDLAAVVPAFGQHKAFRSGRSSGFPNWVYERDKNGLTSEGDTIMAESEYYELRHFAQRFAGASLFLVGWVDTVCPPSSIMASTNGMTVEPTRVHGVIQGHDWNSGGENWWPIWNEYLKSVIAGY